MGKLARLPSMHSSAHLSTSSQLNPPSAIFLLQPLYLSVRPHRKERSLKNPSCAETCLPAWSVIHRIYEIQGQFRKCFILSSEFFLLPKPLDLFPVKCISHFFRTILFCFLPLRKKKLGGQGESILFFLLCLKGNIQIQILYLTFGVLLTGQYGYCPKLVSQFGRWPHKW